MRPKVRLAAAAARDRFGRGTQHRGGVDQVAGQALVQAGLRPARCQGGAAAPGPGSRRAPRRDRTRRCRGACPPGRGPPRGSPRPWSRSRCARWRPAAIRRRRRRAKIGSSTVPVVPDSGRPSTAAAGARGCRRRGRGTAARSVSNSRLPTVSPSTTARCAAQTCGSVGRTPPPGRQDGAQCRPGARSRRTAWRRPGGRRPPPAAPAPARRRR